MKQFDRLRAIARELAILACFAAIIAAGIVASVHDPAALGRVPLVRVFIPND